MPPLFCPLHCLYTAVYECFVAPALVESLVRGRRSQFILIRIRGFGFKLFALELSQQGAGSRYPESLCADFEQC